MDRLARENTVAELTERIQELTETIRHDESKYVASSPAAVDALAVADDERRIDEV